MEKLVVAVGDLHGCLEEFDELMATIEYNPDQMRVVLLGDLVDRGPDSAGCVRRAKELALECIMGNHEDKHLRWRAREQRRLASGKPNPMRPLSRDKLTVQASLSDDEFEWLNKLPLKCHLFDNVWAVHGGCQPRFSLEEQPPTQIIRVRYVDDQGAPKALGENFSQPPNTKYWSEVWTGPESIVYGHCVHSLDEPRLDIHDGYYCLGLDTGCVFGGNLTAAFFKPEGIEYVQVKAKKEYYARYDDE